MLGRSFFVLLMVCHWTVAWRLFHNGRVRGGMLGAPNVDVEGVLPAEHWFVQHLDHFNPTDTRTWKQRYFYNDSFFETGGPVFLMIGGEGEANPLWMVQGAWINYAIRFKALCLQLEHRYYGKSHPTKDLSVKNLVYLSSEQALADVATFIEAMRHKFKLGWSTRWVAFGGSYPGSLAAWLRVKYPHLVHASVSSSGPLIAKADFKEYYGVVYKALSSYNPKCVSAISEASLQVKHSLEHTEGQHTLTELFRLCDPIDVNNSLDVANLFESLASNFAGVVQYNKDNRKFEGARGADITIDVVCNVMMNTSLGLPIDRIAAVNSMLLDVYNQTCLDYKYENMISEMRQASWTSEQAEGGRQWMYQTCTEFGFYQTSSWQPHIFGSSFPVGFFIQQCMDIFGSNFNSTFVKEATLRTNNMYGALFLQTSRVVFIQGAVDPWHVLGVTKTLQENCPAIFMEGTAHCANMYPPSPDDPDELVNTRDQVASLLNNWLSQ